MPRSSSSSPPSRSHLKKISYTVVLSSLSALYSALGPTLVGGFVGARILSQELKRDDIIFDMEISAASMALFGMLSYPYQYTRDYPSFSKLVTRHLYITSTIFIVAPLIIPLIVNKLMREKDYTEFNSLAIGGSLTQLIFLIFILLAFEIASRNESLARAIDYLAELTLPEEEEQIVHHRHHKHPHHNQKAVFEFLRDNTSDLAKQFKRTFNLANARLTARHIKIAMMRSVLKHLVSAWHAEFRDPYSKYFLNEIDKSRQDDDEALQAHFTDLEKRYEYFNDRWYDENKILLMKQRFALLQIESESKKCDSLVNMKMLQAAMLEKAEVARQSILQDPIKDDKSPLDEKTPADSLTKASIPKGGSDSKEESPRVKPKKKKYQIKRREERPPIKLSDLRTTTLSSVHTPTPTTALAPVSTPVPASAPVLALSGDRTPNRSVFFQPPVSSIAPISLDGSMQVVLDTLEKKVFAYLNMLVPEEKHNYKTYIVGGWAYDKVRQAETGIPPCKYNDIDMVTEIPPHILAINFKACPHVKGLFTGKFLGKQLEIIYEPDLADLLSNAKTRDFMTIYIDESGKASDPTKYEIFNLRLGLLYTHRATETMFKDDPLMILRAIYKATKRKLNFEAYKDMIIADRINLFLSFMDSTIAADKRVHPHVINLRIGKLFSQCFADKNVDILFDLGIMETLFPTIYSHMFTAIDWIREQMSLTAKLDWPKLAMIYATFIAPAIVHQFPTFQYYNNDDENVIKENIIDDNLLQIITEIGKSSPLFQDAFDAPAELYNFLRRPLKLYCQFLNDKILLTNLIPSSYSYATPSLMR